MSVFKFCWDESGDPEQDDFYTFGGMIATLDQWDAFYVAWRALLNESPSIPYFKMSDAYRLNKPDSVFFGWDRAEVDAKVAKFGRIIAANAEHQAAVVIGMLPFRRRMRYSGIRKEYRDPYLLAFSGSLKVVCSYMDRLDGNNAKPVLVYDLLDKKKRARALKVFDEFAKIPTMARWLDDHPRFLDEKENTSSDYDIGLQAADYIAWHYRREPRDRWYDRSRPVRASFEALGANDVAAQLLDDEDIIVWRRTLQAWLLSGKLPQGAEAVYARRFTDLAYDALLLASIVGAAAAKRVRAAVALLRALARRISEPGGGP